jgi:hypothetical protein
MKKSIFKKWRKKESENVATSRVVLDLSKEEESQKKKQRKYLEAFVQPRVLKQRQSVYISEEIQQFSSRIVKKLAIKNLTVGVFIDTIVTQHIREHKDELTSIYYKEENDIFENILNTDNNG